MDTIELLNTALSVRYRVERKIGAGGMATVYLAQDLRHHRRVAIKVLNAELGAIIGPQRFLAEIEVTASLQHPHLLPLFDSGDADGMLYYVMPFIEGETLRARLQRERQLPVDETVRIVRAIASALGYAHRHGIIHRDLKPENVLLHDGEPLVMDFGIALALARAGGERITNSGMFIGSEQYMSPEQAAGDHHVDARSDIFSLGVLCYEMLSGDPPHRGSTPQAIIARVLSERAVPLRTTRASVPEHVDDAVLRALEKLPADRFSTIQEFAESLTTGRGLPAYVAPPIPSVRKTPWLSRWGIVGIALLGAAATGAISASTFARMKREPAPDIRMLLAWPGFRLATTLRSTLALSRDGRLLVASLVADQPSSIRSRSALYRRRLDDPVPQMIRGSEDGAAPTISPDGRWVAFIQREQLVKLPIDGGVPQRLADSANSPAWSDRDEILFTLASGLWAVSAGGGSPRLVARPDSSKGYARLMSPAPLPGGNSALVSIRRLDLPTDSAGVLALLSLRDGKIKELGQKGWWPRYNLGHVVFGQPDGAIMAIPFSVKRGSVTGSAVHLFGQAWAGDGAMDLALSNNGLLVYSAGRSTARGELVIVDLHGKVFPLPIPPGTIQAPRVSPDGRRILFTVFHAPSRPDIYIHDVETGSTLRFTSDSNSAGGEWFGDKVIFHRRSGDGRELVERQRDRLTPDRVLMHVSGAAAMFPGRDHVLVRIGSGRALDLYLARLDSGAITQPFAATPARESFAAISPDARLVAYVSNQTGDDEVHLQPLLASRPHVQVSLEGGSGPVWSNDGTVLYYMGSGKVMAAEIGKGPELKVLQRTALFDDAFQPNDIGAHYDVFPDGKRFVMVRAPQDVRTAYMIINWPELMRRQSSTVAPP
jgi:serine/threonine-protein kinase